MAHRFYYVPTQKLFDIRACFYRYGQNQFAINQSTKFLKTFSDTKSFTWHNATFSRNRVTSCGSDDPTEPTTDSVSKVEDRAIKYKDHINCIDSFLGEGKGIEFIREFPSVKTRKVEKLQGHIDELVQNFGPDEATYLANHCPVVLTFRTSPRTSQVLETLLGKEQAFDAIGRCPRILRLKENRILDTSSAWIKVMGEERALHLISRAPSVLLAKGETVLKSMPAFSEVLGEEAAMKAVLHDPNILGKVPSEESFLQQKESLSQVLGGDAAAEELLRRRPAFISLGNIARHHLGDTFDTLQDLLGTQVARAIITRDSSLVKTTPQTVQAAFSAIKELLGSHQAAKEAVQVSPSLLQTSAQTINDNFPELVTIFGSQSQALTELLRNPHVLRARTTTLRQAWLALLELLGDEDKVRELVRRNSSILMARSETIKASLPTLAEVLGGEEEAVDAVAVNANLLGTRPFTMRQAFQGLQTILQSHQAAQELVRRNPYILRVKQTSLFETRDKLVELLGAETAIALILSKPYLVHTSALKIQDRFDALLDALEGDRLATVDELKRNSSYLGLSAANAKKVMNRIKLRKARQKV